MICELTGIFLAFLTTLLVAFIAHRLTIGRDRRKEFNDIVIPIRNRLLDESRSPHPMRAVFQGNDFDNLLICLPHWRRSGLRNAFSIYEKAKQDNAARDSYGGVYYAIPANVSNAAKSMLKYVTPR